MSSHGDEEEEERRSTDSLLSQQQQEPDTRVNKHQLHYALLMNLVFRRC